MRIAKEVRVGLLAIVAIGMFVFGYNYLKGENIFTSTNHYYAEYDKIDNLFKSNPVLLNGYKIGQVSNVEMDLETHKLMVEISVPSSIKVPLDSKIKIINSDMIGSKAIEIIFGDSNVLAQDGAVLKGLKDANIIDEIGDVVTPLSQKLRDIMIKVDTAVTGVDLASTLMAANTAFLSFKQTADELNAILEGKDENIQNIFRNLELVSNDLKALTPRIDSITRSLNKTSRDLSEIDWQATVAQITKLSAELTKISEALNSTEGSMGKLINEDEAYVNLNNSLIQLESLLADMEANPCRYFALTDRQRRKCEEEIEKQKK